MLIILYCVLFNHNSSVCKGYRLRVTIYNDQIKRLVSKSIVPCTTNRKLSIFKATMSTKGTDKHRAPLFRWKLILENFHYLINYVPSFRGWIGWSIIRGFWNVLKMLLALWKLCEIRAFLSVGLADVPTNPVPQRGKDFMDRTCTQFLYPKPWEQQCTRLYLTKYHQHCIKQRFKS